MCECVCVCVCVCAFARVQVSVFGVCCFMKGFCIYLFIYFYFFLMGTCRRMIVFFFSQKTRCTKVMLPYLLSILYCAGAKEVVNKLKQRKKRFVRVRIRISVGK